MMTSLHPHCTHKHALCIILLWTSCLITSIQVIAGEEDATIEIDAEPHPDPNEEDYSGMIYIGRVDGEGRRVGFHTDNGMSK